MNPSSTSPASNPPHPATSSPQPQESTTLPPPKKQANVLDAVRTIRAQDFTTFYQKPCARESLLTGIGAGFAIGGLRFITLLSSSHNPLASASASASPPARNLLPIASSSSPSVPASASVSTTTAATTTRVSSSSSSPISPRSSLSARAWRSMTWAVLSFTLVSAGAHVFCQRRRNLEHAAMARAAEIVGRKREEKRAEALKRREEREARRREHEEQKTERSRWGRWFGGQRGDDEDGKG